MSVAIANSSMSLDPNEQLYNELTAAYPTIPSHVICAVMHQFSSNKYQCFEALKRTVPAYSDIHASGQVPNHWQHTTPSNDRTRNEESAIMRPRSDSAGSISSNSSCSDNQMQRPNPSQPSNRSNYPADTKHYGDPYSQGYPTHYPGNDMHGQFKNVTIEEERQGDEPPAVQHGGWVDSPHQSRKRYPSGYQANPHLASPSSQRPFDGNWMTSQPNHQPSRPKAFAQSFPDKNGDLKRDSPNTPSPGLQQQSQQPSYRGTPPTPPVSSHSGYNMYPIHEPFCDRQGSGYQPHISQGAVGYSIQPPGSHMRPPTSSQSQSLQNPNYKSSIFVPMGHHDTAVQSYRTPSPSQPPKEYRNNPQSLPLYRTAYQQQASSDSSPGTPGHSKAIPPGHYMVQQVSVPGSLSHTPPGQISSPGQYILPQTGLATNPGQYNPSGQYPQYQPHGNPNVYVLPDPYHTAMRSSGYVNVNQPQAPAHYPPSHGAHQPLHTPPFVFQSDWSSQPPEVSHVSPTDGHNFQTPTRQASSTEGAYRRSSAGEDNAYITTLLEHQKKRKIKLEEDMQTSFQLLDSLKFDMTRLQKDLQDRRRTRTHFTATAEDVQKMKQENKKLQVDIHLLTMRIDAAAGDNGQLRLGVLDIPHRDNFYPNIPSGQQVIPSEQQLVPRRVPPPRPPPPNLPVVEREPEPNWCCSACTFENHPALDKCEICEMPRMSTGSKGYG